MPNKPYKFKPKELQKIIDDYFESTDIDKWTITGLALLVGSKQLFYDYEGRKEYSAMVKKARLMVENSYEISLREKGGAGTIFALKNFGWVDRVSVDNNVTVKTHEEALLELE